MADGVDHKYQGKFLQFAGGKWEQYNSDMPGTAFLVITSSFQLQYRLDDRGLVTKKTLVIKLSDAFKYKYIEEKSFLQWKWFSPIGTPLFLQAKSGGGWRGTYGAFF